MIHYPGFDEYQKEAANTVAYPGRGTPVGLNYTILGLVGEAGEIAQKLKKRIRDEGGDVKDPEFKKELAKELGDVIWYCSALADELDYPLGQIAHMNLEKLADRKKKNKISGSGDHR